MIASEFSRERVSAITLADKTGRKIAREYPEIADDYRHGSTRKQILERYGFTDEYGITQNVALTAISRALRLLIPDTIDEISRQHEIAGSIKRGKLTYERGTGLFSMTPEENSDARRKGAKSCYDQGKGIFSLTPIELSDAGRKGGNNLLEAGEGIHKQTKEERIEASKLGVLARGRTVWSEEEKAYFYRIYNTGKYQHRKGRHKGRPDYNKIKLELKRKFGTDRSIQSLRDLKRDS